MEKAERRVNGPMAGQALEKLQSFFNRGTKLVTHH
ncbi:hypothetical protein ACR6EC_24355, partial [Bacillus subtilis]